ncbi:MAG: hypothetical protein P8K08_08885 [Fuerstiella sp.]|jgi:hypothetical protein|nr:hypothetical protein [Fuerstiella sp.]
MKFLFTFFLQLTATMSSITCGAADGRMFGNVECEGNYQHHLQGVCTNKVDAIYWSFTTELVKTDRSGRMLTKIPVANHHGDLCFTRNRIYVAVNHGRFNDPDGNADSWVYVYSGETLELLSKHPTPEVFHGAGGMAVRDGHFFVVGGLPDGVAENYVYEYDADLRFLRKHIINSGWTQLGIQTAAFHDGIWWFGCYGSPQILLKTDSQFQLLGRYKFDCSLGIVGAARDRLLVAKGPRTKDQRCLGSLHLTHPDAEHGLRMIPEEVSALNKERVKRSGAWHESRFRFAKDTALQTTENGASIECVFQGTGVALRLGGHNVPAYGTANLGSLAITIDDADERILVPRSLPRDIVLEDDLPAGSHTVRIEHRSDGDLSGCRIQSLHTWNDDRGELQFHVNGDKNSHLVDCRAILRRGGAIIRNTLVRNWLTGQCSLTALPPGDGYSLEVRATGWRTAHVKNISVKVNGSTGLPPVYLTRDASTVKSRFRFPRLNQPAICEPGQTLRARFLGFDATIDQVRLTRQVGPTVISRVVSFEEDKSEAYYYDREVVISLPDDMPDGAYDLSVKVTGGGRTGLCRSPRSVHVVKQFSRNPIFITFGHLDTSGQYQAEYLQRLVTTINLLAPDMVLCSNACNPAYVSGALAGLDMPYIVNFGNHQFSGHESWYGDPVGLTDCGPHVSVLNFGYPWHTDTSKAEALLASRQDIAVTVINAFEANAPLSLLDKYQVRMIHDAHGIGKKVTNFGATPTRRIGKTNSESFRIIRFRDNQVASCTYNGHETSPIPFPRETVSPLSVSYDRPNDGTESCNTATVTNQLLEPLPDGRVRFVLPAGKYDISGGRLESEIVSDNGRFHVLTVRVDIPANDSTTIKVDSL